MTHDVIIIGGGSGGYAAALRLAELGKNVALVEAGELGGTCLHRGCIPTKALLHSAEVADTARNSAKYGVNATLSDIDINQVNKYKDGVVARLYKGLQGLVKSRKVDFIHGSGTLTGRNSVSVSDRVLQAPTIVLATGSVPRMIPSLTRTERILTSDEALNLSHIPNSVTILGGGVIGVEFASVWKSFGADVTIVEALPHLAPNEDPAVSVALERAFRRRGIKYHTGTPLASAQDNGQQVAIQLEDGKQWDCDLLLVAVGRGPNTSNLGLESVGVTTDRGFVPVNNYLQTNVPGIYAVGDIVPGLQLAHRGFAQGIYLAEHLAGLNPAPIDEKGIPRVTYSNPEVASVGLTQPEAEAEHGAAAITTYEYNLGGNGKSQILGTQGFVKLVALKDGPVIGLHMIGERMGEQIGEAQLIYNWEAHADDVASLIHAHPTQNEALGEAHLALAGKPLHAHN